MSTLAPSPELRAARCIPGLSTYAARPRMLTKRGCTGLQRTPRRPSRANRSFESRAPSSAKAVCERASVPCLTMCQWVAVAFAGHARSNCTWDAIGPLKPGERRSDGHPDIGPHRHCTRKRACSISQQSTICTSVASGWRCYWSCVLCEPDPANVLAHHEWTQAVMLHQQTWKGTRDDLQAGMVSMGYAARPSLGTRQAWRSSQSVRRAWWQTSCSRSVLPWLLIEASGSSSLPQQTTHQPSWWHKYAWEPTGKWHATWDEHGL